MLRRKKNAVPDADMGYKEPGDRRRKFTLFLGVVMAVAATFLVLGLGNGGSGSNTTSAVPMRDVVVAVADLPAKSVLTAANLAVQHVPDAPYLATAFSDPSKLVGKVTGVVIYKNQPLMPSLLSTSLADADFSILGPDETISPQSPVWRAVSVFVPKDRAVGGKIVTGQHVDLINTIKITVMSPPPGAPPTAAPSASTSPSPAAPSLEPPTWLQPEPVCGAPTPTPAPTATPTPSPTPEPSASAGESLPPYYSEDSTKITWQNVEILSADPDTDTYI